MPVDSTHKDYDSFKSKWDRIRDTIAGSDEVKKKRTQYLPKPDGLEDGEYADYVMRAEFYPATTRTVDGLLGAVFRKEPQVEVPKDQETFTEKITIQGTDFTTFAKGIVRDVLQMGRFGVLVDVATDGDGMPFAAGYEAESIINWRVSYVEREPILTLLVLREEREEPDEDGFATANKVRYRVCQIGIPKEGEQFAGQQIYIQSVWEKQKNEQGAETWVQISTAIPVRRGEPLQKIPFTFFGPTDLTPPVQKPPILDLVDTNLSHYRTSAELEEGAYFTGLPMYVVSGRALGGSDEGDQGFKVGARNALRLDDGGSAEVLTVDGEGMGLLRSLMEDKEQRMAVLGARILEDQKAGVEAALTVAMRHRGENSLLGSISDTCSRGLKDVLWNMLWWNGQDEPEIMVELNKDFTSLQLTGAEMVQLTAAFQSGTIGPEVFFKALKDGERIPDGWKIEDWLKDIEEGADQFTRGMTNEVGEEGGEDFE